MTFKKPSQWIGFSNYPNQVHRQSTEQGFRFNLLVVGESGLGKMTLLKSLFPSASDADWETGHSIENCSLNDDTRSNVLQFHHYDLSLTEASVRLDCQISVAANYGDALDTENHWEGLVSLIQSRLNDYLYAESTLTRAKEEKRKLNDSRFHAVLYFLPPWITRLRSLDLLTMRKLAQLVNLIPVIGKADSLTPTEMASLKSNILHDLNRFNIESFVPTFDESDHDANIKELNDLRSHMPFGLVASTNSMIRVPNESSSTASRAPRTPTSNSTIAPLCPGSDCIRTRSYPWGSIPIEMDEIYDFLRLRTLLLRSCCLDLKERQNVYYEYYRNYQLTMTPTSETPSGLPLPAPSQSLAVPDLSPLAKKLKAEFEERSSSAHLALSGKYQKMTLDYEEEKSSLLAWIDKLKGEKDSYTQDSNSHALVN